MCKRNTPNSSDAASHVFGVSFASLSNINIKLLHVTNYAALVAEYRYCCSCILRPCSFMVFVNSRTIFVTLASVRIDECCLRRFLHQIHIVVKNIQS